MTGLTGALLTVTAQAMTLAAAPVPAVAVRGETTCPRPEEVSAALVGLLAPSANAGAPDLVELTAAARGGHAAGPGAGAGAAVTVRLFTAARELIAERVLPEALSCTERARTAAVVVAAWEARLRAVAAPLGPIPAVTPPPVGAAKSAAPPGRPPAPPPSVASPDGAIARRSDGTPGTLASAPLEVETSAAILASLAAGGVAPAVMVGATFLRRNSRFALGIGALAVAMHSTAVGPARGTWRRIGGFLDLQSSSRWKTVEVQMHGGLALTDLAIAGQALPVTDGAEIFDPGLLVGVRLRVRLGRLAPWLDATAVSWPRAHTLYVKGNSATSQVPSYEALLGVGFSLGQE